MKKTIAICVAALFCIYLNGQTSPKKILGTIIIDPGHGGIDPGAKGLFSTEAEVSLAVSLKLGKAIEQEFPDIKLIFTRTTDELPGNKPNKDAALHYRADLANSSGGDLFIAIHCNSAGKKAGGWYAKKIVGYKKELRTVRRKGKSTKKTVNVPIYEDYWVDNLVKGTETYVWALNKYEEKTSSMTENANFYGEIDSTTTLKLPDPGSPEDAARILIYTQNYFRKSLSLATMVERQFVDSAQRISRGVKQRNDKGIWVLQATGMPSILIEIGFISNKEEEEYINSEAGQNEIVRNIIAAIREYKLRLESRAVGNETNQKAF